MVFDPKPIMGTTAGLASTALLGYSAGMAQRSLQWGAKGGKPAKTIKPLIKGFVGITVGTGLLGGIASGINKLQEVIRWQSEKEKVVVKVRVKVSLNKPFIKMER